MPSDIQGPNNGNDRLNGWKEIAAHLGKSVRTVQRWEHTLGLPVRRISTSGGEIIFALRSELDQWQLDTPEPETTQEDGVALPTAENAATSHVPSQQSAPPAVEPAKPQLSWPRLALSVVAVGLVLAFAVFLVRVHTRPVKICSYAVENDTLSVIDGQGRSVWEFKFPSPMFIAAYTPRPVTDRRPAFWVEDLDGDGYEEVLFVYTPLEENADQRLYCFDHNGKVRWIFKAGKPVRTATEQFQDVYAISGFRVAATPEGKRVLVAATQHPFYPSQLAVLDNHGKLVSEYWHSGHINFLRLADLDNDGKDEVLFTGVDNGFKAATLVVLDLDKISGASRELNPKYQILDMPVATERARILFPRSCINKLEYEYNFPTELDIYPKTVAVHIAENVERSPSIIYTFDYSLQLQSASPGDGFITVHREMERSKRLKHTYRDPQSEGLNEVTVLNKLATGSIMVAQHPVK